MDTVNVLRIVFTLLSFAFFIWVCVWAYSSSAKKSMDEAAQLPFQDQ